MGSIRGAGFGTRVDPGSAPHPFTVYIHPKTLVQLKRQEGLVLFSYQDREGVWTIGYGHTRNVSSFGTCTQAQAEQWLREDYDRARRDVLLTWPEFAGPRFPSARREALINMSFNLGLTRLMKFRNMLAAMRRKDWGMVAIEMLDSKWHKQVGKRAVELAKQMYMNEWQYNE